MPVHLQLWSYNYAPEPTGIGPVSTLWAQLMRDRSYEVSVVAAHPHYPTAEWGRSVRPYREVRDGIPVLRLPLWIGRASNTARMRQEASYAAVLGAAAPFVRPADAIVAVSPSFPALMPTMLAARARRTPWFLWVQDVLPDGAATTGLVREGRVLDAARWLERTAYRSARRIAVISSAHRDNLLEKGVPPAKLHRIFNPATAAPHDRGGERNGRPTILTMGNIGVSQGLADVVRHFEASAELRSRAARLLITGDGVAAPEVRQTVTTDRVELPGVVSSSRLEDELRTATVALVSQRADVAEFNLPSKLMNFMAWGLPVIAVVRPGSEVARLVEEAGAGWVAAAGDGAALERAAVAALDDPAERERRGRAAAEFAARHFSPEAHADAWEALLQLR